MYRPSYYHLKSDSPWCYPEHQILPLFDRHEMRVKDCIKMIETDGWYLVVTRGSHRQYKHLIKPGRITIAGHPAEVLAPGTLNSILKQARIKGENE